MDEDKYAVTMQHRHIMFLIKGGVLKTFLTLEFEFYAVCVSKKLKYSEDNWLRNRKQAN